MSVVRLEITVLNSGAAELANKLRDQFTLVGSGGVTSVIVDIRTDEQAARDRTILRAAAYFLREA